ncbi:MAG: chromosomal replication initiator protein DnaA [Bacteroidales bacterium]|nr:chromosomal replication initiator protein DnaA [Bacteroidales bacterium]
MLTHRWNACLSHLRDHIDAKVYDTWAAGLRPLSYEEQGNHLVIGVPSKTYYEMMKKEMGALLVDSLHYAYGRDVQVNWIVLRSTSEEPSASATRALNTTPAAGGQGSAYSPQQVVPVVEFDSRLNLDHSFANYCEGESNKVAVLLAKAIAEVPGQHTFNPLFLYGPSGVGKTHLVNAIGLSIKEREPQKRVLFVSAQEFLTQYVEATSVRNKGNEFFLFYQNIDVLIIDDLHVIESKKGTERAFFHIFNHLLSLNRQIIITCDRAPSQFKDLEERMLTRFKMGQVQKIERPDLALRRLFLETKLKKENITLPEEVLEYIVENVSGSMRELQGTLNSMIFVAVRTSHCELDLTLAREVVSRIVVEEVQRAISFDLILPAVCAYYKVKEADVKSKSRKAQHTAARQLIMYLTQLHTKSSLSQIGRWLGGRDHSTVAHSCKLIEKRLNVDSAFRIEVEKIEADLFKAPDSSSSTTPRSRRR